MQGLTRRWLFRTPVEQDAPSRLPLIERVLTARGLTAPDEVRRFCEPKLLDLHDPGLLPGLDAAVTRIAAALRDGQAVAIYGDYDVDGVAACSILVHVIRALAPGADLRTYVPHRLDEGYGLNADALRRLRDDGADLVVSVDCGVTAHEQAAFARSIGLDLIITDHHRASGPLPDAAAIVHPGLDGYPFADLCGAGVAFKLAWGLAVHWCGSRRLPRPIQQTLLHMLPLAALGTIADVVPLVGENRTIAAWGLRQIKDTPLVGLRALLEASELLDARVDAYEVGFILGPRLNACGRMGHAADAVRLLTDAPPVEAAAIAERLTRLNRQRQQTERKIVEEAARRAQDTGMTAPDRRAIVLADESWHAGVIGIVCSRLVDRYYRPVVLLQRSDGECKGSARSIDGYSIHDALSATAEHLTSYGGHDAAAGLSLPHDKLAAFTEALTAHANANIAEDQMVPSLTIDCTAAIDELELDAVRRIERLSPFGRDNPHPTVRLADLVLSEAPRQIGGQGRHLTLSLRGQDRRGDRRHLRVVWFGAGGRAADLAAGMRLDAVIEPKVNEWKGRVSVEGVVRDVRVVG